MCLVGLYGSCSAQWLDFVDCGHVVAVAVAVVVVAIVVPVVVAIGCSAKS